MKQILLSLFLLCLISRKINAQVSFETITKFILKYDSKAKLDDKLIMISFWSVADVETREATKEMQRVFKIYENAKLLNGSKGVYFLNFCTNTDKFDYKLAIQKDSLVNNLSFMITQDDYSSLNNSLKLSESKNKTLLFNSKGDIISGDFKKEEVFKLLLNQITR